MTFTNEEIAQACDNGADYIETHGWCRNVLESPDGRVCLFGALQRGNGVMGDPHWVSREEHLASLGVFAVSRHLAPTTDAISWNDNHASDQYEVIDALRGTAKG